MAKETIDANDTFRVNTSRDLRLLQLIAKKVTRFRRDENDHWKEENFWYEFNGVENLSLAFHRLIPQSDKTKKAHRDQDKKKFLDALCVLASQLTSDPVASVVERTRHMMESLRNDGFQIDSFPMMTHWRMATGLGGESVLETSMTLHPLYGFPYIPSSALKGIARAYALHGENKACEEEDKKINPNANVDNQARRIFGEQDTAGEVVFFDGIPKRFPELEVDVINVHYPDYYSKGEVPADWMSPIPSFFLTVKENQPFIFYIATSSEDKNLLQVAREWLLGGLTQLGIGAKTNAGYGYFVESAPEKATSALKGPAVENADLSSQARSESKSRTTNISASSRNIPAVVLDNSRKPILVKLLVPGCENQNFQCGDVGNLAAFPPGKEILVDVKLYDITSKTIRMLGSPKLKK